MSGVVLDGDPKTPKALQNLARHKMIERLLRDIVVDMVICELEGWDKMEYITMIRENINSLGKKKC